MVINVGRGALVDEPALVAAKANGRGGESEPAQAAVAMDQGDLERLVDRPSIALP